MRFLSALVLEAFAERGIGVSDVVAGTGLPALRSPCHASELVRVPAFALLLAALEYAGGTALGRRQSQPARDFWSAAAAGAGAQAEFMGAGWAVSAAGCGCVPFCVPEVTVRSGLTEGSSGPCGAGSLVR